MPDLQCQAMQAATLNKVWAQVHCENRYKGSMYGQLTATGLHMEYI